MSANTRVSFGTHNGVWGFESFHGQSNYKTWIKKFKNALVFEGWGRVLEEPGYQGASKEEDDVSEKRATVLQLGQKATTQHRDFELVGLGEGEDWCRNS